jgi:hypothetical protein
VPVRVDGVVIPFLIALAMIGALAGVLRWTFSGRPGLRARGAPADTPAAPPPTSGAPPSAPPAPPRSSDTPERPDTRNTRPDAPDTPNTPAGRGPDDFGLLATVAIVATIGEADRIRARLRAAGIRATTAPGPHGRYRVLVFESEVHRARRLGGPTT